MRLSAIFLTFALAQSATARDYVVTSHGVVRDSTLVQTRALQAVIDTAAAAGGGTIVVPRGTFLSGALFFKPGTRLRLQDGARLKGSDDINDYPPLPSRFEGKNFHYHPALINAYHVHGFEIAGPGTVDGNGRKFWNAFWQYAARQRQAGKDVVNIDVRRPRLIFLWGCDSVRLHDANFQNPGLWTCHLYKCRDVRVERCRITAAPRPQRCPSTDAIDLDCCHDVVVRACYFNTDDDGVCIKSGKGPLAQRDPDNGATADVLIDSCTAGPSQHALLTLGSECLDGGHIAVRNCRMEGARALLHLKLRPDTYQHYHHISIDGISGRCATLLEMRPWTQYFTLEGTREHPRAHVHDITLSHIDAECRDCLVHIEGNPDDTVERISLEHIRVNSPKQTFTNAYPEAVLLRDVSLNGKAL